MDVFGGAPRFLSYPRTFTVPNGADAVLKCQIAGDPRPTVIWERDKTQISPHGRYRFLEDGNVYNLVVSRARVEDSGQYICKAKNSVGETYAAATLKVEECDGDPENRPAFVVKPTSARVVRGHDVVFTGRLAGSPMPAVTWEKDGKKLTEIFESGHFSEGCDGEGWHHLKIFSARMPDAGVYLCKARNPLGEAMSAAVLLVEPGDAPHEPAPPTTASNGLGVSEGSGAQRIRREARRGKRHRLPHREPHSASGVARQSHATEDPPRACKVKVFSVTEGKHAKFRCYVTGKPKPEIFWRKDGRLVAPGRRHLLYEDREGYFILKVLYCKQQDNGLYACAASNAAGQTLSSVLLNVKEPRIKFKNQLQDVEVNEREQAILECEVPGDSIPAVWYLEDRKLHSSAKYIIEQQGAVHRLTIKDVTMDDDGVYLCEMKDGGRSIAEVAVKGKIVKRLPRKLDVVEGENAAFCVDLDEENVEVSWYKDGELLTESHKTIIKSFGKTHILVFVNVTVEDSGVITFVISDSKSSSQLRVKPRRHIPPSAPVNVRMSCEKPNVASLLWASPPDCQRNGVTGYVIERQELGTEEWVRCLTTEGSTVVEILGESVSNEARYRFRVCSVNNYGKSEQVEFPGVVHLVPSARIRTHLSDMTLYQDTDAEFTIELSTSVLGTWHMKGQQLHNDERFKIDQSRTRHMLLIRGVKVEENESEITFVAHGVRDSAILFVKAVPVKITLGPGMETVQQITASESIILCCEVSRPNTKVQWCKDGEILTPSDRVSVHSSGHVRKLIVQSARPSDSGQYVCDATEDSLMFTVNVLASPVRIVNTTDDTKMEYLTSECIVLTCELSRSNAEVKWYRNGLEIEGSGKVKMESHGVHRSLIIEKAGTEDSGEYVCDAGDDSIFYDITVREPPVRIVNSSSSLLSVLTGGEIVLSCEVSQPKAEVRWYKDGVEVEQSERSMMEVDRGYRKLTICPAALGDQGTYVCKAVDISAKFEVTVSDPPVRIVDSTSPALNVLTGSELVLLCEVSQPEAEVRWYKDGVEVEHSERAMMEVDGRCRRLTIHPATMGDQGTYVCDAVDVSAKFEVTVSEPPVRIITSSSPVLSVLTGSKIFLSCELSQPQGEVRWHKDGVEVEQSERSTMEVNGTCRRLTICPAVMDDQGIYMCDAVDDLAKFEVTVSEPPVRIINSSSPVLSVLTGAEVVLMCELSRPKAEVSWYKDGVEVKQNENCRMEVDGRRRRLTIRQVTVGDGGIYLCDAIDDAAKFEVTVSEPPIRIMNHSSPVLSVLTGSEIVLSCELSRPEATVRWYKDGVEMAQTKRSTMEVNRGYRRLTIRQVTLGDRGMYLCDAIDDSVKFEVTVSEPPVRIVNSSPPVLSVLTGAEVVLSCELSRPKTEVRWYKDGVELKQNKNCTMEVNGRRRRLTIRQVTVGDGGLYLCDAVDDSVKFEVTVTVPPVRIINSSSPVLSVLTGAEVVLSCELSRPKAEVRWYKDGIELKRNKNCRMEVDGIRRRLTIRQVTVGDGGLYLCDAVDDSAKFEVTVSESPVRIINSSSPVLSVLTGNEVVLSCELSRPKVEVRWYKDGVEVERNEKCTMEVDGRRRRLTIQQVTVGDRGTYVCDAVDDSAKFEVAVSEPPVRIVNSSSPVLSVPTGAEVVLSCELSRPKAKVKWYKDGVEVKRNENCRMEGDGRCRRLIIRQVTEEDGGIYLCDAIDDSAKFEVTVTEPPVRIVNSSSPVLNVLTGDEVALSCELSRPKVEVRWFKDGVEVEQNEKCTMEVDGRHRRLAIRQVTVGDRGTYLCDAVDDSVKFEMAVSDPPVRIVNSSSPVLSVLTGSQIVLSCELSQHNAEVRWFKDGVKVERNEKCTMEMDGKCRRLTIRQVTLGDRGTYLCDAVEDSAKFEVTVSEPPIRIINSSSPALNVLTGDEVILSCELSRPKVEVRWFKDGVEVERNEKCTMEMDGRRRRLTIHQVTMGDRGTYLCDAVNDLAKFDVNVSEPPVRIVNSSSPVLIVLTGAEVVLSCELTQPKAEVRWYKDAVEVKRTENCTLEVDGRRRRLTIHQVTVGDGGTYMCDAVDDSAKFEVTVSEPPVRIVNSSSAVLSVLTGAEVVLSCELSQPKAEVRWYKDGVEVKWNENCTMEVDGRCRRLTIRQVTVGDGGIYLCDAVDDSAKFEVNVSEPPIRIVNSSSPILNVLTGDEVVLSCELSWPKAKVRWFHDGVEVVQNEKCTIEMDGRCRRLTIHRVTLGDRGTYLCDAVDDLAKFELSVSEPPVRIVNSSPPMLSVLTGGKVVLSCELSRPKAEVRWYKDGVEVEQSERSTMEVDGGHRRLTIHPVTMGDRGTYLCDAVDDLAKFEVTVSELPLKIIRRSKGPAEHKYLISEDFTLQCELSRSDGVAKWYKDGEKVVENKRISIRKEGMFQLLRVLDADTTDTGEYLCDVQSDSIVFRVCVEEPPIKIIRQTEGPTEHKYLTSEVITLQCELSQLDGVAKWYKDGEKMVENERIFIGNEGAFRSLRVLDARTTDSGEYLCDVQSDSVVFGVCVQEPPVKIIRQTEGPAEHKYLTSENIMLQCELSRLDGVAKWYKDGEKVVENERISIGREGTFRSLRVLDAQTTDSGEYLCDVQSDRIVFRVHVEEPLVKIIRQFACPAKQKYLTSEDFVLQCELSRPDVVAKWYKNGEKVVENERISLRMEGTFRSLQVLEAQVTDSGEYLCDVQSDSIVFRVHVEEPPVKIIRQTKDPAEYKYLTSEDITLQCELSWPDGIAKWYKDRVNVVENERITMGREGTFRSLQILDARTTDSGEYLCDVQSDNIVFRVRVEDPPVMIVGSSHISEDRSFIESETIAITCKLCHPDVQVRWSKDGIELRPSDKIRIESRGLIRELMIFDSEPSDSGQYVCDADSDKLTFKVTVTEAPVLFTNKEKHPEEVYANENGQAVLAAIVSKEPASVTWYRHKEQVTKGEKYEMKNESRVHSLIIKNVLKNDSGFYICRSTDDEMIFNVNMTELPLIFVLKLEDVCVQRDGSITLWCELNKVKGDVMWLKDGKEVRPSRKHVIRAEGRLRSLTLCKATLDDEGEYSCESKDDRTVGRVSVRVPRVVEFISDLRSITVLEGDDAKFKCMVSPEDVRLSWHVHGREVPPGSTKYVTSRNGLCHMLLIQDCQLTDIGQVIAEAEGIVSTANLQVQETQVVFTRKLVSVVTEERQDATFEVEVSNESAEVQWMKQGVVIQSSPKFILQQDGRTRRLIICDTVFSDRGNYRCETLHDRTQAKLIIEPRRISVRKPLEDMEIFEKEAVTFQVELSHVDVDGMWIKDGIRVKPNNNRRISCTGKVHSLTLSALTLEDSGTVTFQADNVRSTSRITVREPPVTFLKELKDLRVPESTAITLECELSRPNVEVIWYKDDLEMKPNKNVRIYSMGRKRIAQLGKCGVQDSGTYSCDAGECKTSGKLEVFEQEIQIVKELEDQEVRENNNAVFVCEVSHAEVKSEWLQNGNRIKSNSNVKIRQEGTKHFMLIYKVRAEDAGEIRFRAKNAESVARLDVNELPVKIVKPLRDKTALEKHKVILECKVSKPHAHVCWYRGGEELYASSKYEICSEDCYRQLVIHDVSFEDEATYTCDAFDDCSSAKVLVEEQAILIMKDLVDMEVTAPNAIQLECEVSVPMIRAPQWSLNGQLLQNGDGVRIENRGTIQRLILSNTSPDMSGVVKFTAGKARCSAKLTVKGE